MSLAEDMLRMWDAEIFLKKKLFLPLKLAWLLLTISAPLLPYSLAIEAFSLILGTSIILLLGGARVLLRLYPAFWAAASIIVAIDYIAGTEYLTAMARLFHTFSTVPVLISVAATTPAHHLEVFTRGRNIFSQAMLFMESMLHDLNFVSETFRARGHRIRGPLGFIPLITAFLSCMTERLEGVEDSLRARGAG